MTYPFTYGQIMGIKETHPCTPPRRGLFLIPLLGGD